MAQQLKSAGDGATPGSAAQTGTSSLDQAHNVRAAGASSFAPAGISSIELSRELRELHAELRELAGDLRGKLRRLRYLADASAAYLAIYRGVEIDREEMAGAFEMLVRLSGEALDDVERLDRGVSHAA